MDIIKTRLFYVDRGLALIENVLINLNLEEKLAEIMQKRQEALEMYNKINKLYKNDDLLQEVIESQSFKPEEEEPIREIIEVSPEWEPVPQPSKYEREKGENRPGQAISGGVFGVLPRFFKDVAVSYLQSKELKQKPTLYTDVVPDLSPNGEQSVCGPCVRLDKELTAQYGADWKKIVDVVEVDRTDPNYLRKWPKAREGTPTSVSYTHLTLPTTPYV